MILPARAVARISTNGTSVTLASPVPERAASEPLDLPSRRVPPSESKLLSFWHRSSQIIRCGCPIHAARATWLGHSRRIRRAGQGGGPGSWVTGVRRGRRGTSSKADRDRRREPRPWPARPGGATSGRGGIPGSSTWRMSMSWMVGMTEVRAPLARSAAFRCLSRASACSAAAASRRLASRRRRSRLITLIARSTAAASRQTSRTTRTAIRTRTGIIRSGVRPTG